MFTDSLPTNSSSRCLRAGMRGVRKTSSATNPSETRTDTDRSTCADPIPAEAKNPIIPDLSSRPPARVRP